MTIRQVANDVSRIRSSVDRLRLNDHQCKIIKWLYPPDPSTNYNKALGQHQEGSGLWFLQNDVFAKWKTRRNSFLWLYGIPGWGKTILSSTIIKDLSRTPSRQPLLYFYFDFNDTAKQTLESMVRSLISQLCYRYDDVWKQLDSLFSSCQDGRRQPTCESLCMVLLHTIEQIKEVWIILDALDECRTRKGPPAEGLLSWIKDLLGSEQRNVHLLMTSRPEQDIKSGLSEFVYDDNTVPIQSDLITNDIRAYVRKRVREDEGFKRWQGRLDVQDEIKTRLMEKADGMLVLRHFPKDHYLQLHTKN